MTSGKGRMEDDEMKQTYLRSLARPRGGCSCLPFTPVLSVYIHTLQLVVYTHLMGPGGTSRSAVGQLLCI